MMGKKAFTAHPETRQMTESSVHMIEKIKHKALLFLWRRCNVYIDHEGGWYDDWELASDPILVYGDTHCRQTRIVYKCRNSA